MAKKPTSCMASVLRHDGPEPGAQAINVNVAMLTMAEKKVLQNSPAREVSGGMVVLPKSSLSKETQMRMGQALHDANPSPKVRSKGRSSGGGKSSIVF